MRITNNYQVFSKRNIIANPNCNRSDSRQSVAQNNINEQNITSAPFSYDMYRGQINKISFKSSPYERELRSAAKRIFDRNNVFGIEEYNKLLPKELDILKTYQPVFKHSDLKCINFMQDFAKLFSERIHEKYPNGFTFVAIGRSPAFLAKYLELQGEDVKYCPISNLHSKWNLSFSPDFVRVYKKYLDNIGLTKDFAETTQKPILITDYTYQGASLHNFKTLLESPEIGIKESKNVKYCPITYCSGFKNEDAIFDGDPYDLYQMPQNFPAKKYIEIMEITSGQKKYTSIPYIDGRDDRALIIYERVFEEFRKDGNKFAEDFNTKMMNFIMTDSLYGNKQAF